MSFASLLDRRVTIIPRSPVTIPDEHGVKPLKAGEPIENVHAAREQFDATEAVGATSRTVTKWVYFFPAGTPLTEKDQVVDAGETFEVDGEPERPRARRGEHHVEAILKRVRG